MEGKFLCEIHFAQVRLRNDKIRVPDFLKLQRSNWTSTKNPSSSSDSGEQSSEEITKELPFGRMAISPLPESVKEPAAKPIGNPASLPAKLGLENPNHRLVNRRFKSKNVEQPPISTVKVKALMLGI